jgi:GTP-binding protein
VHILLTKADKLKRGAAQASLMQVRKGLGQWNGEFSAQLFSALKREGLDQAYQVLAGWLALE